MPFVVPGQQQPQPQQQREGRGGGMERRDYASQQPGPAYRPPQQQQGRGGGYEPWQQQRQQQYRQPQMPRGGGYQQMPQPQQYRGGGRQYQQPQYQQPQQRGYDGYGRQPQPQYQPQMNERAMTNRSNRDAMSQYQNRDYSTRPQLGNYVGEGVYADGTPMPPMPSSGDDGQSLIQSNAGPAGGVYSGFNATPPVNGGDIVPRPYFEEDDVYNKPMYTRRGGGGIR